MKFEAEFYTRNGAVYDKKGRFRILRGFCVSEENSPVIGKESDADLFFTHLVSLGCTLIFWKFYWKSIEPDVPDGYDEDYLARLRRLFKKAEEYDVKIVLEPSVGQWNRVVDSCGAPLWTLDAVGFSSEKIGICEKTFKSGSACPEYVNATMNTLFWGSELFAPELLIEGDPISEYLQSHYIGAMKHVARRLKDCTAIIGFGCMYDAAPGYITFQDMPNPCCTIKNLSVDFDVWKDGFSCPWKRVGVLHTASDGTIIIDDPYYFCTVGGFAEYFLKPFQKRFIEALEKKHEHYIFFPEAAVTGEQVAWIAYGNLALAPNFIVEKEGGVLAEGDIETLKMILPFVISNQAGFVAEGVERPALTDILHVAKDTAAKERIPLIVIGSKTELQNGNGTYTGIISTVKAAAAAIFGKRPVADNLYNSIDELQLSFISDEGLFSDCDEKELCRPYACAVNGTPLCSSFHTDEKPVFEFEWNALPQQSGTGTESSTELFIPSLWYPDGWVVELFDGVGTVVSDPEHQRLYITTLTARKCRIKIVPV